MAQTPFDPSEAVTFDLAYGHVHLDGAPNRVLVPSDALVALCEAAGDQAAAALGGAMGKALGHRVAVRLAPSSEQRQPDVAKAPWEGVVEQLAGELALLGLGSLGAERWGKALVLVVDQSPLGDRGDSLLAEILSAAFGELSGKPACAVRLERNGVRARFVVVSEQIAAGVRQRLSAGTSWGAVLAKLHPGGPPV